MQASVAAAPPRSILGRLSRVEALKDQYALIKHCYSGFTQRSKLWYRVESSPVSWWSGIGKGARSIGIPTPELIPSFLPPADRRARDRAEREPNYGMRKAETSSASTLHLHVCCAFFATLVAIVPRVFVFIDFGFSLLNLAVE